MTLLEVRRLKFTTHVYFNAQTGQAEASINNYKAAESASDCTQYFIDTEIQSIYRSV